MYASQTAAAAKISCPALMQTHHALDAPFA